ncbi:MAG: glycoside hydrolase family 16 protein [Paludibacter sp.]
MTDLKQNGTAVTDRNPRSKKRCAQKLLTGILCTFSLFGTAQDYKLAWEDNFDNPSLNEKNWTIVVNGKGGGNRELQYYRKENISIGKEPVSGENCLIITARKENYKFHKVTSGRISTQHKIEFKHGKIEAKIKFPKTANGLWPAFWLLGNGYPNNPAWPKCGEIDIVEMGNEHGIKNGIQDRYFNGACHWGERFNHGRYPNYAKANTNPFSLQEDFHLFTLIWDENALKMYLDLDKNPAAAPYFEMPIGGEDVAGNPARYFHREFFVLFNLAVGGNFTQIRHLDGITALKDCDAKMYVDYVRIYQKGTDGEIFSSK